MKGGIMNSQRAIAAAGYQPPALPFAQLPNPDSVLGRVYIASNVGPAPGIELIAAPGRWRPRGGRQVLAQRGNNPVTMQSLSSTVAETIGPFPGGLVRAGMHLEGALIYYPNGITTASRTAAVVIGNTIPITLSPQTYLSNVVSTISSSLVKNRVAFAVSFGSDGDSEHRAAPVTGGYNAATAASSAYVGVNISIPWYVQINLTSAAETAVNISSATWAGGIATFNTAAAHTLAVGDKTVTAGVTPSGWNIPAGAIVLSVPTTTQFTVALAADPGAYTSGGTSSRISNVTSQSYVLELVG